MSVSRALQVLRKDLELSPRSPLFLYALAFPLLATLLIQLVFGSLFEPVPRLGIVDGGDSRVTAIARDLPDIDVRLLDDQRALRRQLEDNDLDAGLVLPQGFDDELRQGRMPELRFQVSGGSLAKHRMILAVVIADLVRDVAGTQAGLSVQVLHVGDGAAVPLSDRLVPFLVMFAVLIAGLFVPAASLVEEKEKRTLSALLVTPATTAEVLAAKGAMGFGLAMAAGTLTLALNDALGRDPVLLVAILAVATLMALEIGLVVGSLARDSNALLSVIKGGNIVLLAPTLFFLWPDLPAWVAKALPTYYFLHPLFEVVAKDAAFADVWRELAVALGVCAALLPAMAMAGRRMAVRLAAA